MKKFLSKKSLLIVALLLSFLIVLSAVSSLSASADTTERIETIESSQPVSNVEEKNKKIYCNATSEDDFDESSVLVVLDEQVSQYSGIKNDIKQILYNVGAKTITDLSALSKDYLNSDGSINEEKAPALAEHYKESPFRQILKIQLKISDKQHVLNVIKILEKSDYVISASPNYNVKAQSVPDDPFLKYQWALEAETGINVHDAWDVTTGSKNVRVGVIDSGIAYHNDLNKNVVEGYDFYYNNSKTTDDVLGHGTKVAGIIAAEANNGRGVSGIAPNVTLVPLQNYNDGYNEPDTGASVAAINYAINLWGTDKQISILNYSVSGFGWGDAIMFAVKNFPGLFVWAAGNDGRNVETYKFANEYNLDNLISVGAIDKSGQRSVWSATGSSCFGKYVNIFAPGGKGSEIYVDGDTIATTGLEHTYVGFNGTSAAAPHVTGVAALMLSANPNLTAKQLKSLILKYSNEITINTPYGKQNVKKLNAGAIFNAKSIKNYNFVIDQAHWMELTPKLLAEKTLGYNQTCSYTAPESMVIRESSGAIDERKFTAWRMNINGTDGYNKETNPWIEISTSRELNVSVKDLIDQHYPLLHDSDKIYIRAVYNDYVSQGSCIAEGSLITLADGSQKAVQELTGNEMLLVWNMFTGTFDTAPILCIDSDPADWYEVIKLYFSDGTQVDVISEHGFWDFDLNEYVYLDNSAEDYIGHWFNKQTSDSGGAGWTKVQLTDVSITQEYTTAWSPVTYGHLCYYVNGMLTMPGGIAGLFNIFEADSENMRYDEDLFYRDIEIYGTYTYEEFAGLLPVTEELFNAVNGQYLKVAIGKGLIDIQTLSEYTERYSGLFA